MAFSSPVELPLLAGISSREIAKICPADMDQQTIANAKTWLIHRRDMLVTPWLHHGLMCLLNPQMD
jgi:hypothetical protein